MEYRRDRVNVRLWHREKGKPSRCETKEVAVVEWHSSGNPVVYASEVGKGVGLYPVPPGAWSGIAVAV